MKETFYFDNTRDMMELAMRIQTEVYWGSSYYIGEDDDTERVRFRDFWEHALEEFLHNGAISVTIGKDFVVFNYKKGESNAR